jgi:NTE family protein
MTTPAPPDVLTPVHATPADAETRLEEGIALCLSGGGYRAMVFHVGVLWRLNETKLLSKIKRFSSVSGGSITAGVLASRWGELQFDNGVARNFVDVVVEPVRKMAGTSVDLGAVLWGSVLPGSIADRVANAYRKHLFGDKTLQDLPEKPRFVFNATNLESGVLFRFSKPYMGDYRVGRIFDPTIELAVAVAASSAFPPVLSPCVLDLRGETWKDDEGNDLGHKRGFRDKIKLADGGVYDNLGLETAWKRYKTILVSDAGGHVEEDPDPASDWLRQTARVLELIDNQVRSLRKRQVIESFTVDRKDVDRKDVDRKGMYVGIRSEIANLPESVLKADPKKTIKLAELGTRLSALRKEEQERLINWGYIVCDAGLRSHVPEAEVDDRPLPYPKEPLE